MVKIKNIVITHVGEDLEQGKHSSIVSGSAHLYSHFENQYAKFSENLELTYLRT